MSRFTAKLLSAALFAGAFAHAMHPQIIIIGS